MNGVFAAYDADAYTSAMSAAKKASRVLKGESPLKLGVTETEQGFIYDYKQLDFFHIDRIRFPPVAVLLISRIGKDINYCLFFFIHLSCIVDRLYRVAHSCQPS